MTVLLVDDELDYRSLVSTVLSSRGFDVIVAENGEEALGKIQGLTPDLVITDIYMPVMDGIKMSRALRALPGFGKVPILFLSGYEAFLRKGSPLEELVRWIDYLTTPAENRPYALPRGTQTNITVRSRDRSRTFTNFPIL